MNKLLQIIIIGAAFHAGMTDANADASAVKTQVKQAEKKAATKAKKGDPIPNLQSCLDTCNGGQDELFGKLSSHKPGDADISDVCSSTAGFCHDFPGRDGGKLCESKCRGALIDAGAGVIAALSSAIGTLHGKCEDYCTSTYKGPELMSKKPGAKMAPGNTPGAGTNVQGSQNRKR